MSLFSPRRLCHRRRSRSAHFRRPDTDGCARPKTSWHGTVAFLVYDRASSPWKNMYYTVTSWQAFTKMRACAISPGFQYYNIRVRQRGAYRIFSRPLHSSDTVRSRSPRLCTVVLIMVAREDAALAARDEPMSRRQQDKGTHAHIQTTPRVSVTLSKTTSPPHTPHTDPLSLG